MPFYNQLLGYTLNVSWNSWSVYGFLACVIVIAGFLAGGYPAFFLSAFSPIQALKGKLRLGKGGSLFRQSLVVLQFSISVFLIIGTMIIMIQMKYVKAKNLGYDEAQTAVIRIDNDDFYDHRDTFKHALQNQPAVCIRFHDVWRTRWVFRCSFLFKAEGKNDELFKLRIRMCRF